MRIIKSNRIPQLELQTAYNVYASQSISEVLYLDTDTLILSRIELIALSIRLFDIAGVDQLLNFNTDIILNFVLDIEQEYLDNPYHCFRHAVDVAFYAFCIVFTLQATISELDRVILLIAALCHDMGHPGRNNLFLINSESKMAHMGPSILETYSATLADQLIMNLPLGSLESQIRLSVRALILYTDMANHFELRRALCSRSLLLPCILHAADVSNSTRDWEICRKWSSLVIREFSMQLEDEISLNIPITIHNIENEPLIAMSFYDSIILPYFMELSSVFPKISILVDKILMNHSHWSDECELSGTPAGSTPQAPDRRISVAAGTITIPEDVFTILPRKSK